MLLLGWYIGVALKVVVGAKLALRRWVRRLPCFSFLMLAICVNDGLALATYGTARNLQFYQLMEPVMVLAQVLAVLESFWWLASSLPKFKRAGMILMALCLAVGFALEYWTRPDNSADIALKSLADIERSSGFGLFFFAAFAMFFYSVAGNIAASAWRHACILASISIVNAVGWQMIQRKVPYSVVIFVITNGTAICFAAWLWLVTEGPTWRSPEGGPYNRNEQDAEWKRMRKAAGL